MAGAILEHQKLPNAYLQQLAMVLTKVFLARKKPGGFYAVFKVFSITEKEQTKKARVCIIVFSTFPIRSAW